jgi:glycosyltransferase involved in cell wall biosynthesis
MPGNPQRWIAVLGRRDGPTDGVADYCEQLGAALGLHGYELETVRMPWPERGWAAALADLRRRAEDWSGCWVLLQHTALSWSRRGFPLYAPRILAALRESGARCGVVFHEFGSAGGSRIIDRARNSCQMWVLKRLYRQAERAIFTVPLETISWLPSQHKKAVFIPIGANCPELHTHPCRDAGGKKTVAVFSVTGGAQTLPEIADICFAVKRASRAMGPLRLVVMGRGSKEAEPALQEGLFGTNVAVEVLGLVSAEKLSRALARADVQLFVRGHISNRRGTAIAGIACGLPIVCYAGPETGWPLTEAGILSVPLGDREALSAALERVLSHDTLRDSLAERSRRAQKEYFSWSVIAARYAHSIGGAGEGSGGGAVAGSPDCSAKGIDPVSKRKKIGSEVR